MIFLLLLVCIGVSCKKDSTSNSASYLKGKMNAVAFECTTNLWATPAGAGNKIIAFRGDWGSNSIRFYMDGQGADITTGTYDFVTGIERNATFFEDNDGYGAGYFSCLLGGACVLEGSGKITILEISNKLIRGTFEFITRVNGATGKSKTVTEGDFYIKRS